jgi:hypothetical protein
MRISNLAFRGLIALCLSAATGCSGSTDAPATLVLTTEPDFSAGVDRVLYESATGPAGPYSQYDIWVIVPPGTSANAGVVLSTSAPVFLLTDGTLFTALGSEIRVGDQIQVWRDPTFVAYGSAQGPPGSPTYTGTQIVIVR